MDIRTSELLSIECPRCHVFTEVPIPVEINVSQTDDGNGLARVFITAGHTNTSSTSSHYCAATGTPAGIDLDQFLTARGQPGEPGA